MRIYEQIPGQVLISYVAEDLGAQEGLLYSPAQIRTFLLPRMKRMMELVRGAGAYVFHHSDGAIRAILPDLIDAGIEVLNPVQWRCRGMERAALKRDFGGRLVLHGGVDNQRTLPFGSADEVRAEVEENLRVLGAGGGYILAPCHNIQPITPVENIVAMYEAGYEIGALDALNRRAGGSQRVPASQPGSARRVPACTAVFASSASRSSMPSPGFVGQLDRPVAHLQRLHGDLAAGLLEVHEILEDDEVRHHGRRLHAGGQGHRGAVVVVRRDRDHPGLGHRGDLLELEDAAAVADVGVDDVGGALLEDLAEGRPLCTAPRPSRSAGRCRAAPRPAPGRFSGGTGSSYQKGRSGASFFPTLRATAGARRRCASTSTSKSGPTASRTARTLATAWSSAAASIQERHGPGNGSNLSALKPRALTSRAARARSSGVRQPAYQPLA